MSEALDRIVDALDIETYFYCKSEEEARDLAEALIAELRLPHGDIVFLEHRGWGARVRIRTYIHRPGDHYRWMDKKEEAK
jgi:sulfopyruvate decarboxylase TPP-binding subunit